MRNSRQIRKLWCGILLGSFILTGCSQTGSQEDYSVTEEEVMTQTKTEQQTEQQTEELTGREILESLIEDKGFCERVWYDAEMNEEDTKEMILEKLNHCENLILREPPYGNATFSLEGLRLMPNLQCLIIDFSIWDDSNIEDFTPILELSQLKELYFSYASEEKIALSFLAQMPSITELYLPNCNLEGIDFLGEMPQLERLSLYETYVEDLSVLEKLPKLVELALSGNAEAANIEVVGKLLLMEELGLQDCGLQDIQFLSNLTELRAINLNYNFITDLTPLEKLSKLERLGAAANQISDIRPLAALTDLFDLALDQNQIEDISALAGLSSLNQLGISDNQITDLSPLAGKENLMFLSVFGNPCRDLRPVWQVPLLNFTAGFNVSEEQKEIVDQWMKEYNPDIEEYMCVDYVEGDLNGDGRADAAFVVDEGFYEEDGVLTYDGNRHLFVLLRQQDGSWKESKNKISILDRVSGGVRGDPHYGLFIGDGYLLKVSGWGSRMGCTETEGYVYRDGKLELVLEKRVWDDRLEEEYQVEIVIKQDGEEIEEHYRIIMEDHSLVRKQE